MRKLFFALGLFLPFAVLAQSFSKAPKLDRPVKQIIEWQTFPAIDGEPEETQKGGEYTFRRDGKLATFKGNGYRKRLYQYDYDGNGRVVKVDMSERNGGSSIHYTYGKGFKKAEIKGDSLYLVTTHFMDEKGNVVEEKTSGKAWFTANKFTLISRKVLNYNDQDSLFGEMEYLYKGGTFSQKKKTVHHFNPDSNLKTKSEFFDEKGKLTKTIEWKYDDKNRKVAKEIKWSGKDNGIVTEYLYKDGALWQEIENNQAEDEKIVRIYKEGRLVRTKIFVFDELITYTDFQYIFY